jgi:chemotaxis signal transduction protein
MATTPFAQDDQLTERIATALGLPPGAGAGLTSDSGRRYGLTIGGQRFLLDLRNPVHVVDVLPSYRLPNTRAWCLGLVNLRGSLVPLFDLAACFELPEAPADRRMMLVLGEGDDAAATLIDGPPRHVLVGENQGGAQAPSLHPSVAPHATTAYRLNDGVWVEVDWQALFMDLRDMALLRTAGTGA